MNDFQTNHSELPVTTIDYLRYTMFENNIDKGTVLTTALYAVLLFVVCACTINS